MIVVLLDNNEKSSEDIWRLSSENSPTPFLHLTLCLPSTGFLHHFNRCLVFSSQQVDEPSHFLHLITSTMHSTPALLLTEFRWCSCPTNDWLADWNLILGHVTLPNPLLLHNHSRSSYSTTF